MRKESTFQDAGINTDPLITGFGFNTTRRVNNTANTANRIVKHIKIESDKQLDSYYDCGDVLGQGMFGTVYEVTDIKDKKKWAMKVIIKKSLASPHMTALQREIQILKILRHPHIVVLREIYETSKKMYLIIEKCDSDLAQLINRKKSLHENEVKLIIADLTGAVSYLHKNDIVHRDIKLENVLVTTNPNDPKDNLFIKLTDFGLSIIKTGRGMSDMLHDQCGTILYMAPEIIQSKSYSQQCDIWAAGVIFYALLTSKMPFFGSNDEEVINQICNVAPNYSLVKDKYSVECTDLLQRMLEKNPAIRITACEIMHHPFLTGQKIGRTPVKTSNVLEMMRLYNKDLRQVPLADAEFPMDHGTVSVGTGTTTSGGTQVSRGTTPNSTPSGGGRRSSVGRQSLTLSVQNVSFDKRQRSGGRISKESAIAGGSGRGAEVNVTPTRKQHQQQQLDGGKKR